MVMDKTTKQCWGQFWVYAVYNSTLLTVTLRLIFDRVDCHICNGTGRFTNCQPTEIIEVRLVINVHFWSLISSKEHIVLQHNSMISSVEHGRSITKYSKHKCSCQTMKD